MTPTNVQNKGIGLVATFFLAICLMSSPLVNAQIEEVIVTAEKRAESVQDVGISMSAFDENTMEKAGIDDVTRLELIVPGVNFAYAGNDAKFNVRGANSTNTFNDNGSIVGAFVDGVYKPRASQQTRAFFDVERIEFLKGPQGTLYGRNTFAGALNLYTKRPELDGASGGLELGYERFNTIKTEGYVNVPLSDQFALRLAGFTEDGDGYLQNNAGPNKGQPDEQGFRASLLWQPNDDWEVIARGSHITEKGTSSGLFGYKNVCRRTDAQGITDPFGAVRDCNNPQNGAAGVGGTNVGLPNLDSGPWDLSQDFVPNMDVAETNVTLEINWDAGPVAFKSTTSYTDFENLIGFDFDYSPVPFNRGWFDERAESITQELNFSSTGDGPLQWTSGAYYSQDETFFSFTIFNETLENNNRVSVAGPGGQMYTLMTGTPIVSLDTNINGFFGSSRWIEIETLGLYGQAEYSFTDNLRVIGGLRYNDESKDLTGGGSNFTGGGAPVNVLVPGGSSPTVIPNHPSQVFGYDEFAAGATTGKVSFDNITWKAGLEYDFNDHDAMAYFTASTGFLSGSLNSDGTFTDEQESQLYEVGIKSILADGNLLLNVSAHYTEYTNLVRQFQVTTPVGGVQTFTANGGSIDAWGLELESAYYVTDQFQIGFNASYLDSEFGDYAQTNPYQLLNGVFNDGTLVDVSGETTGWSPDFTATITASYEMSLADKGTLTPSVQFYYSDGYNTSNLLSIDQNHDQGSYTKTDLRLIWRSPSQKYSLEGFIENLEDEAVLGRGNNGGDDNVQTGYLYPRNYGVKFKVSWD